MILILIVILLVLAMGGAPTFGWHEYGWGPSGIIGVVLIILVVLLLVGRI